MEENNQSVEKRLTFEDFKHENGITFWWASEYMKLLGYDNMRDFNKVINRATQAFISAGINHHKQIVMVERESEHGTFEDFKMTRFACYMAAMNGDPKKPQVAKAQAYFAQQARQLEVIVQDSSDIERLLTREEIKKGNISLNAAAKKSGVMDFAKFNNAGYIGLYNMGRFQLETHRSLPEKERGKLLDHMGRTELAANLFRVTQTEERLKSDNIKGQHEAEKTHFRVASQIRDFVKTNTGKNPESLPLDKKLPEVKKELKAGMKKMEGMDKTKKGSLKKN